MHRLRVLNLTGIGEFRGYLRSLREDVAAPYPDLNVEEFSHEFRAPCDVDENVLFKTKMDMARYLSTVFSDSKVDRSEILGNGGIWTWLSYLWIDQLAPRIGGKRKVGGDERHIYSDMPMRRYRHLVATPYSIFSAYGEDKSRLVLYGGVSVGGDYVGLLASTGYIISSPGIVETATKLYWDEKAQAPKRGAQSKSRLGNIRRFVRVLGQLEMTYDVSVADYRDLIDLLPAEFDGWKAP